MRVALPQASYANPEQVVEFYQRLVDRVRHAAGRARGRRRALAAARLDDRRLRPARRGLRPAAGHATRKATGRSSPTATSRRWASVSCAAAASRRPTQPSAQLVALDQRGDGARYWAGRDPHRRAPQDRRRPEAPMDHRRRHRRRRAPQRHHRSRQGEVLRSAHAVAHVDRQCRSAA